MDLFVLKQGLDPRKEREQLIPFLFALAETLFQRAFSEHTPSNF